MRRDATTWAGLWGLRAREMGFDPDPHRRSTAEREYAGAADAARLLESRWRGGGSPVLRGLRDRGVVELLGGPSAHPFLPLLMPELAGLALQSGLADSAWRLGERPRGIWSPECGWHPALAQRFTEAGVGHFVVDEQTVRDSGGHPHAAWRVAGTDLVAVPRNLEVTNLIWSSRSGYPASPVYRDFHAREEFTGIRLWAITEPDVDVGRKRPYDPAEARAQVDHDVAHFVDAVRDQLLHAHEVRGQPGLVVAAYDTELFGHWWHEGPVFLGKAIRALRRAGVTVTTLEKALAGGHVAGDLDLAPGSWGAGKDYSVWDGPAVRQIAHENEWLQRRWLDVLGRERAAGPAAHPTSRPRPAAPDPVARALQRLGLPRHPGSVRRLRAAPRRRAPSRLPRPGPARSRTAGVPRRSRRLAGRGCRTTLFLPSTRGSVPPRPA